jgi:Flp pilus assembly protein TadG
MAVIISHRQSRLLAQNTASMTVEFAACGFVLLLFMFVIINIGDLGLIYGSLRHGVAAAARNAALQTGVAVSQNASGASCVTNAQVASFFDGAVSPIVPFIGAADGPVLMIAWTNNAVSNTISGSYITVTIAYRWNPIALPRNVTIPLTVTATQIVEGTSGSQSTSC